MPIAHVNGIDIDYLIEGDGPETVVMVNGLADEKESWGYQTPDLLAAGYRVLTFDNRGVGKTSMPPGPYTTRQFADDTKALVDHLGLSGCHMVGTSMGGMIAQEYALAYSADLKSLTLSSTYAAPGPFCGRMFSLWADMAPVMGVATVMRDVTLWAFTRPFVETRAAELEEFEAAMADITSRSTPTSHSCRPSRPTTPPSAWRASQCPPWSWPARRTSSSRSSCPGGCTPPSPGPNG